MNPRSNTKNQGDYDNNSHLTDQTKSKIENIRKAFLEQDKDLDNEISQDELLSFLDSNMKNGQKFDRTLASKIFQALDLDQSGKITVEEFIKNYMSIEEEIKTHAKDVQTKLLVEKERNSQLQKLLHENQNEKLNVEGIGQNAKITIEIYNIEFVKIIEALKRISIRIRFDGESKETKLVTKDDNIAIWKEKFEFKVARKDILYFEVINNDDVEKVTLGTVKFPLDRIERQEEYELELEIPDEDDDNLIMAKINAKIQFIWSIYKYYQDMYTKNERALQNCNTMLQKTTRLLENLNEPFKFVEMAGTGVPQISKEEENRKEVASKILYKKQEPSHVQLRPQAHPENTDQYQMADKIENLIKTTFSKKLLILDKPNIQWMGWIKLFIITLIILGFINTFERSDFLNILVPTVILVIFYTTLNNNVSRYLQMFLIAIVVTVAYDFLWIIFSSGTYASGSNLDGGKENSVRFFVFITSFAAFIIKILLGLSIWIQRLKLERGDDDSVSNKNLLHPQSSGPS